MLRIMTWPTCLQLCLFSRISWTVETKKMTRHVDTMETCTIIIIMMSSSHIHSPGSMTWKLFWVLRSESLMMMTSHPVRLPAHHTFEVAVWLWYTSLFFWCSGWCGAVLFILNHLQITVSAHILLMCLQETVNKPY